MVRLRDLDRDVGTIFTLGREVICSSARNVGRIEEQSDNGLSYVVYYKDGSQQRLFPCAIKSVFYVKEEDQ